MLPDYKPRKLTYSESMRGIQNFILSMIRNSESRGKSHFFGGYIPVFKLMFFNEVFHYIGTQKFVEIVTFSN